MNPAAFYDREYFEGSRRQSPPHTRELIYPTALRTARYLCRQGIPHRALDLGCAKGFFAAALRDSGVPKVIGMDVSWYAVSQGDSVMKGYLFVADASAAFPLQSASCDLVTALDLFEHLPDPLPTLEEIRRLLNEQGRAYVKICHPSHPNAMRDPSHVNVRPLRYWTTKFQEAGLAWRRVYETDVTGAESLVERLKSIVRRFREWAVIGTPADYKFLLRRLG